MVALQVKGHDDCAVKQCRFSSPAPVLCSGWGQWEEREGGERNVLLFPRGLRRGSAGGVCAPSDAPGQLAKRPTPNRVHPSLL